MGVTLGARWEQGWEEGSQLGEEMGRCLPIADCPPVQIQIVPGLKLVKEKTFLVHRFVLHIQRYHESITKFQSYLKSVYVRLTTKYGIK